MIRHIIAEGPDGGGKSTLVKRLVDTGLLVEYPRAVDSVGGPPPDLDKWVSDTGRAMMTAPPSVFDRHALISEPIYGPICRGGMPGMFNNPQWRQRHTFDLMRQCLIIWCLPPYATVQTNVLKDTDIQMDGVVTQLPRIYNAYRSMSSQWGGASMFCNYERGEDHMAHVIHTATRLVVPDGN